MEFVEDEEDVEDVVELAIGEEFDANKTGDVADVLVGEPIVAFCKSAEDTLIPKLEATEEGETGEVTLSFVDCPCTEADDIEVDVEGDTGAVGGDPGVDI